jgi:hypothetical protein
LLTRRPSPTQALDGVPEQLAEIRAVVETVKPLPKSS